MQYENTGYCNNCGKRGHSFHKCKLPITSYGIIAFRQNPDTGNKEYLMICRKHTLGFIDFMRGKYVVYNKYYILNMIKQMTDIERKLICDAPFEIIWEYLWGTEPYNNEENMCRDKLQMLRNGINTFKGDKYSIASLVAYCTNHYVKPEWGFPKGRRDGMETDIQCAMREFFEETGYNQETLPPGLDVTPHYELVENIHPFQEIFMGSNYKSYKHKYYLMKMDYDYSCKWTMPENNEISEICWMPFLQALTNIRNYNLEKRKVLVHVNTLLTKYNTSR
jgi:8-oxo-dGTP pyrophosphatase MutT (NUDIX family)